MSGHSKWHRIRHKKAITDSKRSKLFGALSRDIRQAARAGADPEKNSQLREAIARAKSFNLPQTNIDRLLSTGPGQLTDVTYEGYGPGGVAFLVQAATDNTNRTVAEVRKLFKEYGGSLGEPGSVAWQFTTQAEIVASFTNQQLADELELAAIEAGADETTTEDATLTVLAAPTARQPIVRALTDAGATIEHNHIITAAPLDQRTTVTDGDQEKVVDLTEALRQHDDVLDVTTDTTAPVEDS